MSKLRYISSLCNMNFARWKTSLRILMLLAALLLLQVVYAIPQIENAKEIGYPLQLFESYIAAFSAGHSSLLVSTIAAFIIADVPIRHKGFEYAYLKGTKNAWLCGQWLYIVICAFILCAFMLLANISISIPYAFTANEWSIATLITSVGGKYSATVSLFSVIPEGIIQNTLPLEAMIATAGLQLLMFIYFGMLTVTINLLTRRVVAPLILVVLNAVHWLLRMFVPGRTIFSIWSWISPLYHGTYSEHQYSYYVPEMASPCISSLLLIGSIIVFCIYSHMLIKKRDILAFTEGDFDE